MRRGIGMISHSIQGSMKSIRRIRRGENFNYVESKTGKRITDATTLTRIKSLRIPPAYTEVEVCGDSKSKVQAFGYDSKGRKQTIYNKDFVEQQRVKRFQDLVGFDKTYERIKRDVAQKIVNANVTAKDRLIALLVRLMITCHFRIGSADNVLKYKTYGLTTLENRHAHINSDGVVLDFVGKKGVQNTSTCRDPKVVKLISALKKIGVAKDPLFKYREDDSWKLINATQVNDYLKTFDANITSKDLRTYKANIMFIENVKKIAKTVSPASATAWKTVVKEAIKSVAAELHNTPAVCKKDYIHRDLIAHTETDSAFRRQMKIA